MFTGHPKGLFRLFFIEMWERLAFYTMVGVLVLYTLDREKGGLGMPEDVGNEIYGLYLAFVYFTPYLGGLIADRFLGYRRSVLLGGLFFAGGFFLMFLGTRPTFVTGLVCLCVGNGFFKPNISAMVGNLYEPGDKKRDAGFNIFYMGINIGAFAANFLAAVMRNKWGWEWIFFAAGIGMLIGITILLASWKVLERADRTPGVHPDDTPFREILLKILLPAAVFGVAGYFLAKEYMPAAVTDLVKPSDFGFLIGAIPIILFFIRLEKRAEPEERPGLRALLPVYIAGGTFFMVLHLNGSAMTMWARDNTDRVATVEESFLAEKAMPDYYGTAAPDLPRPNKLNFLPIADERQAAMFGQRRMLDQAVDELRGKLPPGMSVVEIPREGATGELAEWGRSKLAVPVYNGITLDVEVDPEGGENVQVKLPDAAEMVGKVVFARELEGGKKIATFLTTPADFEELFAGDPPELPPGDYVQTLNSELYQSFNAFFVILFTPLVVLVFTGLARRGREFTTAKKIFAGMVLTTLALLFMALAGYVSEGGDRRVSWIWLAGFYAIVTLGELCLSPMALSLVTKLSPKRLVGLTMGGWFFAIAVGNKFSGFLGGLKNEMLPGPFFLVIAAAAACVALFIYLLLPKLDAAMKRYGA